MRCLSCNKFPAFSMDTDPELDIDVEAELETVTRLTHFSPQVEAKDHCANCNQPFAEHNNGQCPPDVDDPDHAIATVTGTCRIVLTSECCGDECKETQFDIEVSEIEIKRGEGCVCDLTSLSITGDATMTDRMETTNAKGKRINPRYARRYYGASGTFEVSCDCTKTSASVEWQDEVQASSMDEMN